MDSKKIGATIAMLRTNKKMTQADLGDRIGVTFQAVSKWERGETLPDISILPTLADIFETTIDYILRGGESTLSFKGKVKISDLIDGLNCLKIMRQKLGQESLIYRYAIEGINNGMNTDIEPAFTDDYVFEAFLAETIIQSLMQGMYVDITDIMHNFRHEHFRNVVLEYVKKYSIV